MYCNLQHIVSDSTWSVTHLERQLSPNLATEKKIKLLQAFRAFKTHATIVLWAVQIKYFIINNPCVINIRKYEGSGGTIWKKISALIKSRLSSTLLHTKRWTRAKNSFSFRSLLNLMIGNKKKSVTLSYAQFVMIMGLQWKLACVCICVHAFRACVLVHFTRILI